MTIVGKWRRLAVVGALEAGILLSAFNGLVWVRTLPQVRRHDDFRLDYAAAVIGLERGWSRIYDLDVQKAVMESHGFFFQPYLSPPPLAWLAAPFTALPFEVALALWTLLLVAALAWTWWLAAPPGSRLERSMHLLLCIGLFPAAFGLMIGQPVALVAAAVATAWWLLRHDRDVAAGLVLTLLLLKPQLGLLVPLTLLASYRFRAFAAWAGASAIVGAAAVAVLGADGVRAYLSDLAVASQWTLTQHFTTGELLGHGLALSALQAVIAGLALLTAWRFRDRGPEMALAAGLSGSLLVTPYIGFQDFLMLVLAGWLVLRSRPSAFVIATMVVGYVALELGLALRTLPVVASELAFFAALCTFGVRFAGESPAPRAEVQRSAGEST